MSERQKQKKNDPTGIIKNDVVNIRPDRIFVPKIPVNGKIPLNNTDIIDIYSCPVFYYARQKLGVVEDSSANNRNTFLNGVLRDISKGIILLYYAKQIKIEDIDALFVKSFYQFIQDTLPREQIAFFTERFRSFAYAAEIEKLVGFLSKHDEFFSLKHHNAKLSLEGSNFIYTANIDCVGKDNTLYIMEASIEIPTFRYYNTTVIGSYLACLQNGIEIKSIRAFPYIVGNIPITGVSIPNEEQIDVFLKNLESCADIVIREDYYPRPQWRCTTCQFEYFCKSYRSG